jgi:hypothetical protein
MKVERNRLVNAAINIYTIANKREEVAVAWLVIRTYK